MFNFFKRKAPEVPLPFCRDCKYSETTDVALFCNNEKVIDYGNSFPSSMIKRRVACFVERLDFAKNPCGQKGKLWEAK